MGLRPVQLDQTALAAGATGRNGGFVTQGAALSYPDAIQMLGHVAAKKIWELTRTSRDLLRDVVVREQIACDYREPGTLHLNLGEAEQQANQRHIQALKADGFDGQILDKQQLQDVIGQQVSDDISGAGYAPGMGLLHSAKFIYGLAAAAQRYGAKTCVAQALGFEENGAGIRVRTNHGVIETKALFVAANAWTRQVVGNACVKPVRGQMLCYAPIAPVFAHGMGVSVTPTGEYWQQTPTGEIVIGGCRAVRPDRDENLISMTTSDDVQEALEQVLPRLFPALRGLRVVQRWGGPMAFTPDYLPIADAVPGLTNAYFAGGFCGHGMPFGMIFGKLFAEALATGQPPVGLESFAARRAALVQ
jgi:glycine/D-amino acid oxidase-like deaminating enzyme